MAFANTYHRRQVGATAAKPCFICYKPTAVVLNQADGKDWLYTCAGHLTDRGFAIPVVDEAAEAAKRRQEELDREIELVKKEYEEKLKKKKKSKDKDKDKGKDKDKADSDEKDKDDKIKELEGKKDSSAKASDGPRVFELHKSIYQMRLARIKNAQQAKQLQERLSSPAAFPSVPKDLP